MISIEEKIKYIRVFSDIHLDFDVEKNFNMNNLWMPEELPTDKDTLLVLSGDIWHAKKPFAYFGQSWMEAISKKFKYIICVLGNHDFWGGSIPYTYNAFKTFIKDQKLENVFLLQNETMIIGDIKIVGGTLWTDFNDADKESLYDAKNMMNDYKYIKYGNGFSKLKPHNILIEHRKTKEYIFQNAYKDFEEQKLIVITHHAPSYFSINTYEEVYYQNTIEDSYYASDFNDEIEASQIDLWIHGHTHYPVNYSLGKTQILSNPRGYEGVEHTGYCVKSLLETSTL